MASDLDARARRQEREDREKWTQERAEMLAENQRLREQLARVTKRFKLTQTALVEQQKVLDRYHQELVRCGSKAVQDKAVDSDPLLKKRNAENLCNEQVECDPVKRAKPSSGKQRHSLPLAERHSPDSESTGVHSSPIRRRSLPEPRRQSDPRGVGATSAGAEHAWVTRKQDMESTRPSTVISATELLRPRQLVRQRKSVPETSANASRRPRQGHADVADSEDEFLNDHDAVDGKTSVVKTEHKLNEHTAPQERSVRDQRQRPPVRRRELPFRNHPAEPKTERAAPLTPPSTSNAFAYVEVVRNREERAALPGHDCVECRKYYEALDGLVAEDDIKAKCSRHRARFTPYQTPDDFWRLSFPDSQSQDMMSP